MKRATGLVLIILACITGIISVKGMLPFVPVSDSSMEPALRSGGILKIETINAEDIKVGDIIVYTVPPAVRDYYNYPPTVSHRVIEIQTEPSLGFLTRGDNTGEDPFTVRPMDIRGTVSNHIPYLGLPFLPFQSQTGVVFVIVTLVFLVLLLYIGDINRGINRLHRSIFSPLLNKEKQANRELDRKIETAEKKMDTTERALLQFSTAVADYARHLASHTSAIQGLSEASHELKMGAAEQNRVLNAIMDSVIISGRNQERASSIKEKPLIPDKIILPDKKPVPSIEKAKLIVEKLVSATSELEAKNERLLIVARKSKLETERLASISMQPAPEAGRYTPLPDKLVFSAQKAIEHKEEKPVKIKSLHPNFPTGKPVPPGCVHQNQEQLWR